MLTAIPTTPTPAPAPIADSTPRTAIEPAGGLVLRLQATVLSHPRLIDAATAFASDLAEAMHCERVSVGLVKRASVRLVAISSGRNLDAGSDTARALGAAMNEAFDQ